MNLSELNAWAMNHATVCDARTRVSIYAEVANALECVQQGYPEWSACQQAAFEIKDLVSDANVSSSLTEEQLNQLNEYIA